MPTRHTEIAQNLEVLSRMRGETRWVKMIALGDILLAIFMLTQPALFAELIYPLLTPHGILLAIYLLAWWRVGRGLCVLMAPRGQRRHIASWLWLASAPLHSAALVYLIPQSVEIITWHLSHLAVSALLWRRA